MSKYRMPEPGPLDPIENLNHYTGNLLSPILLSIGKRDSKTNWERAREILSGVLGGFADGTYGYSCSQAFNPEVAAQLRDEVLRTVKKGASANEIRGLEEKLLSISDEHAIQTGQPERTRAAVDAELTVLRAERQKLYMFPKQH